MLVCKYSFVLQGSGRIVAGKEGQMLGTAGLSLQGDTLEGGGNKREVRGK